MCCNQMGIETFTAANANAIDKTTITFQVTEYGPITKVSLPHVYLENNLLANDEIHGLRCVLYDG